VTQFLNQLQGDSWNQLRIELAIVQWRSVRRFQVPHIILVQRDTQIHPQCTQCEKRFQDLKRMIRFRAVRIFGNLLASHLNIACQEEPFRMREPLLLFPLLANVPEGFCGIPLQTRHLQSVIQSVILGGFEQHFGNLGGGYAISATARHHLLDPLEVFAEGIRDSEWTESVVGLCAPSTSHPATSHPAWSHLKCSTNTLTRLHRFALLGANAPRG
jgi:hypothetical protein